MSEHEGGGDKLGWLMLGGILASAFWWWQSRSQGQLPVRLRHWRGRLAAVIDEQGRHIGEGLAHQTHAWSERLKPNGQSKRIPVDGQE
jgi:hypothetical protein